MKMKVWHRLPCRDTAGVKQIDAICADSRLIMRSHFLNNSENATQNFCWHGKQIGVM